MRKIIILAAMLAMALVGTGPGGHQRRRQRNDTCWALTDVTRFRGSKRHPVRQAYGAADAPPAALGRTASTGLGQDTISGAPGGDLSIYDGVRDTIDHVVPAPISAPTAWTSSDGHVTQVAHTLGDGEGPGSFGAPAFVSEHLPERDGDSLVLSKIPSDEMPPPPAKNTLSS